jgi:GT2 family glycosyltransferase
MGWIGENQTSEIEILAGAFMLLRRKALNKIGLLDESFFMYGEDIDLSYRLTLGGYKNYYFPETYIIHFKGQSTRKLSWRYIQSFYGAMFIFVRKYFLKF